MGQVEYWQLFAFLILGSLTRDVFDFYRWSR